MIKTLQFWTCSLLNIKIASSSFHYKKPRYSYYHYLFFIIIIIIIMIISPNIFYILFNIAHIRNVSKMSKVFFKYLASIKVLHMTCSKRVFVVESRFILPKCSKCSADMDFDCLFIHYYFYVSHFHIFLSIIYRKMWPTYKKTICGFPRLRYPNDFIESQKKLTFRKRIS